MNSVSKSKVSRAIVAIGVAGILLAAIAPASANKNGKHDKQEKHEKHEKKEKHGKHEPKTPKNPGPIGPLPKPPAPQADQPQWHAQPKPEVRDHRLPSDAKVTDHRTTNTSGGVVGRTDKPKIAEKQPAKPAAQQAKPKAPCFNAACPH